MAYPTDIMIDEDDRNVFLDDTGDLGTITGLPNLEQSVAIMVMNATQQFIGDRITGASVGLLEEKVRQALDDDPQIAEVVNVELNEFDRGADKVIMEVTTTEQEIQLGVTA